MGSFCEISQFDAHAVQAVAEGVDIPIHTRQLSQTAKGLLDVFKGRFPCTSEVLMHVVQSLGQVRRMGQGLQLCFKGRPVQILERQGLQLLNLMLQITKVSLRCVLDVPQLLPFRLGLSPIAVRFCVAL